MLNEIENKAYMAGYELKLKGLSEDVIYARLEKQGFPEEIARKVANDIFMDNEKEKAKENFDYGIALISIGLTMTIISSFIFENTQVLFIGLILSGLGIIVKVKK